MSNLVRGFKEPINLFLRALLIMLIPMSGSINLDDVTSMFPPYTTCFLYTPQYNSYFEVLFDDLSFYLTNLTIFGRNFILGILLSFPAMVFAYKVAKKSVNQRMWPRGLLAAGITLVLPIILYILLFTEMWWVSPIYYLMERLFVLPSLIIPVFIGLPLIKRFVVRTSSPQEMHGLTMRDIESYPFLQLSRNKIFATILWIGVFFTPIFVTINSYWYYEVWMTSISYSYNIGFYGPLLRESLLASFVYISSLTIEAFAIFAALSFLRFRFINDIFRCLDGMIEKRQVLRIGLLGDILPTILFSLINTIIIFITSGIFVMNSDLQIPLPFLTILGFVFMNRYRPAIKETYKVWDDDIHLMWWEDEPIRIPKADVMQVAPEDWITVPVDYILTSQVRKLRNKKKT